MSEECRKKAAKCARESGWRSPFALLLVHYRLFKSLSVNGMNKERTAKGKGMLRVVSFVFKRLV
jgi:hypothetical protein